MVRVRVGNDGVIERLIQNVMSNIGHLILGRSVGKLQHENGADTESTRLVWNVSYWVNVKC